MAGGGIAEEDWCCILLKYWNGYGPPPGWLIGGGIIPGGIGFIEEFGAAKLGGGTVRLGNGIF